MGNQASWGSHRAVAGGTVGPVAAERTFDHVAGGDIVDPVASDAHP